MPPTFSPIKGAQGYQQSNPCVLAVAALLGSLKLFKKAGMMQPIRERSVRLTGALEAGLRRSKWFVEPDEVDAFPSSKQHGQKVGFTIITPPNPSERGAQLSLLFLPLGSETMRSVFASLMKDGVVGDEREPDVIRLAPAALYNTLGDCERAVEVLEKALEGLAAA